MKIKMAKIKEAWFISRDGRDFTLTNFKSKELAEKYAKKMGYIDYEIKMMYLQSR